MIANFQYKILLIFCDIAYSQNVKKFTIKHIVKLGTINTIMKYYGKCALILQNVEVKTTDITVELFAYYAVVKFYCNFYCKIYHNTCDYQTVNLFTLVFKVNVTKIVYRLGNKKTA